MQRNVRRWAVRSDKWTDKLIVRWRLCSWQLLHCRVHERHDRYVSSWEVQCRGCIGMYKLSVRNVWRCSWCFERCLHWAVRSGKIRLIDGTHSAKLHGCVCRWVLLSRGID